MKFKKRFLTAGLIATMIAFGVSVPAYADSSDCNNLTVNPIPNWVWDGGVFNDQFDINTYSINEGRFFTAGSDYNPDDVSFKIADGWVLPEGVSGDLGIESVDVHNAGVFVSDSGLKVNNWKDNEDYRIVPVSVNVLYRGSVKGNFKTALYVLRDTDGDNRMDNTHKGCDFLKENNIIDSNIVCDRDDDSDRVENTYKSTELPLFLDSKPVFLTETCKPNLVSGKIYENPKGTNTIVSDSKFIPNVPILIYRDNGAGLQPLSKVESTTEGYSTEITSGKYKFKVANDSVDKKYTIVEDKPCDTDGNCFSELGSFFSTDVLTIDKDSVYNLGFVDESEPEHKRVPWSILTPATKHSPLLTITPIPPVNTETITVWKGDTVKPEQGLVDLPDGSKVSIITPANTSKPGDTSQKVKITFTDGSSRIVTVPVIVKDKVAWTPLTQAKKHVPWSTLTPAKKRIPWTNLTPAKKIDKPIKVEPKEEVKPKDTKITKKLAQTGINGIVPIVSLLGLILGSSLVVAKRRNKMER